MIFSPELIRSRSRDPACALDAYFNATFFNATRECAVGSIHEEFPGRQGHALKLGSSSTIDGSSLWTRRNFSPFSLPEVSSSQSTPRRHASSWAPRRPAPVTASAEYLSG